MHGSKLEDGGRMNENAIHGAPKKGWEWRIALSNNYAWFQSRRWRTHERKRNSWASEKRLRMENCSMQSLRMAPNSRVEDTWTKTQFMGLRKRLRMENCTNQSLRMAPNSRVEDTWAKTQFMGLRKRVENGELHKAITTHGSKLEDGGRMNENTIHGAPKKGWKLRIALSNHYAWLRTRGWRTHVRKRNSWGSEKDWEWRIALRNHYAWLQTRRWRTHERKFNLLGSKKNENGELH